MNCLYKNMETLLFRNQYRIPTTRLQPWDYSQDGWYYVTICTKKRLHILGTVKNQKMQLSPAGKIVQKYWKQIPEKFQNIKLETFIIMPNHLHGILLIDNPAEVRLVKKSDPQAPLKMIRRTMLLSMAIGRFKMQSAKEINLLRKRSRTPVWQSRFYDHIIRKRESMYKISQYILNNPAKWESDRNNLENIY